MNKIYCYLNDNYIQIKKNKEITKITTDSIKNGDIIDSINFIKDIKKEKLFNTILTNKITIYLNHEISEKDIMYYKNIFEDLNCTKINILSTTNKLDTPTLIKCGKNYIIYLNNNYTLLEENYLKNYLEINKIKEIKVISDINLKENKKCKYYYYNNSENFFLN